jgi:leucyl-tRNA synthetase
LDDTRKRFLLDKKLWRAVQSTIMSVTNSYSRTYSLNTVVSDLMALTKVISEPGTSEPLQRAATLVLIQLLAPVAPATAEECWSRLQPPTDDASKSGEGLSVFDHPFPTTDETHDLLAPDTQICAVQINGKTKFATEMSIPDKELTGKELERWIVREIMATAEGQNRLTGPMDISRAKKVIVVRGGKTVNFVI